MESNGNEKSFLCSIFFCKNQYIHAKITLKNFTKALLSKFSKVGDLDTLCVIEESENIFKNIMIRYGKVFRHKSEEIVKNLPRHITVIFFFRLSKT